MGVVVAAYDVAAYLPACLDSLLGQTHRALDVVVVDDGSTDATGEIAERYAARDPRLRVVHTANHGLGAARNEGVRHVSGEHLAFVDSDDVVPPEAYATMLGSAVRSGSDFVSASFLRWEPDRYVEPPFMKRLHTPERHGITLEEHPELLGDVFAWDKMFRRSFWDDADLSWPEGVRYEDQPTTTRAYLAGRFDVLSAHVYHWRIRSDGSSITQQRASVSDLADRVRTKRMSLETVRAAGSADVQAVFLDRVLAGDLWRYFAEIPDGDDEWWGLLRGAVAEFWGERSLVHSGLPPVHRLTGWLVEQDRRDDAATVMRWVRDLGDTSAGAAPRPVPQVDTPDGRRIDVPVLDLATVDPAALVVRAHEAR